MKLYQRQNSSYQVDQRSFASTSGVSLRLVEIQVDSSNFSSRLVEIQVDSSSLSSRLVRVRTLGDRLSVNPFEH